MIDAILIAAIGAALINILRLDNGIDEHDHNVLDAEYEIKNKGAQNNE